MTSHQIVAVDVPQPLGHGRVERTATAGRTLGAGGSAGTNRTHGRPGTYTFGCRCTDCCTDCRTAWATYAKARRKNTTTKGEAA